MQKDGGKHLSKKISIFYMLNSKNGVFNPYFSIGTCLMFIIHPCMHAHLHPDMKIIKTKASNLYEKKQKKNNFTSSGQSERGKFWVIILPKSYLHSLDGLHAS